MRHRNHKAMRRETINKINVDRLTGWKDKLNKSHATPVILIGVAHDHNQGQIVVCTTEERSDQDILLFMREAVRQLETQITSQQ